MLLAAVLVLPGCPEDSGSSGPQYDNSIFGGGNIPAGTEGGTAEVEGGESTRFGEKEEGGESGETANDAGASDSKNPTDATGELTDTGPTPTADTNDPEEDSQVIPQPDVDTYVAVPTDISFEDPDTGCTPSCEGKVCGSDGCGSVCGFCEYGKACDEDGLCLPICDPLTPCLGKDCGADGCGGVCGDCPPSFSCGAEDGLCYESECEPQCEDKECGPDGCGGVCGSCQGTKLCDTDVGVCVSNPCGSVDFKGACADQTTVVQCLEGELVLTDCTINNPLHGCVWNPIEFQYQCDVLPSCTPDCSNKQCGDGGCSYSCGDCFNGWDCIDFQCTPQIGGQCGTVSAAGKCISGDLYFCSGGFISVEPCTELGKTCQFNPNAGINACL